MTPPADGSILSGITRDSILNLIPTFFPEIKIKVEALHIDKFCELHNMKKITGSFVSGTASVVGKVHSITHNDTLYKFEYPKNSLVSQIKKMIVDIQLGKVIHPYSEEIMDM